MKKYLSFIWLLLTSFGADASQEFMAGSATIDSFYDENVFVPVGATISGYGGIINVDYTPVFLHNDGKINADINAGDNILYIYNTGNINGDVTVSNIGVATQMVTNDSEFTPINFVGNKSRIQINGVEHIDFNKIKNCNANYVDIKTSSVAYIEMDNFQDWQNWDKNVSIEGEIVLVVKDKNTVIQDVPVSHVTSGDKIHVKIIGLEDLYKSQLEDNGANLILRIVRETNYDKVFDDSSQSLLETIRKNHPGDNLLEMLDGVDNADEMNRIKNLSYRFNHEILLRPIRVINNFMMTEMIKDKTDSGVGFIPSYVISDKISSAGGRIYIGHDFDNIYFNAGFSLNHFSYKDKLNKFSGLMYGLDLKAKQEFGKWWSSQAFGITLSKTKADYICVDDKIKNNPFSFSGYGKVLVGYDFNVLSDVVVSPFGGLAYQKYKVIDINDSDFSVHGGADIKYSFVTDGIKYEYSASSSIGSNGDWVSTLRAGFWSVTDLAGASLNASIIKDDLDYHYKLSATAKMLF